MKKICVNCNILFEVKSNSQKYCTQCSKNIRLLKNRGHNRRYRKTIRYISNQEQKKSIKGYYKHKEKIIACVDCGKLKQHHSLNRCYPCWKRFWRLNNKLSNMSDYEKESYLIKHNLLKKVLTIEDLKRDLKVIK